MYRICNANAMRSIADESDDDSIALSLDWGRSHESYDPNAKHGNYDLAGHVTEIVDEEDLDVDVGRTLPWWCVIIAWSLVASSIALAAFFTILFSLQWGKTQSEEWLKSFMLSFFESVVLIQPIKVSHFPRIIYHQHFLVLFDHHNYVHIIVILQQKSCTIKDVFKLLSANMQVVLLLLCFNVGDHHCYNLNIPVQKR